MPDATPPYRNPKTAQAPVNASGWLQGLSGAGLLGLALLTAYVIPPLAPRTPAAQAEAVKHAKLVTQAAPHPAVRPVIEKDVGTNEGVINIGQSDGQSARVINNRGATVVGSVTSNGQTGGVTAGVVNMNGTPPS